MRRGAARCVSLAKCNGGASWLRRLLLLPVALVTLGLSYGAACASGAEGRKTVALIAEKRLTPEAQCQVDEFLKANDSEDIGSIAWRAAAYPLDAIDMVALPLKGVR